MAPRRSSPGRLALLAVLFLVGLPARAHAQFTEIASPAFADSASSQGAAWGDYDGDGDPDLYVTNINGEANQLIENQDGVFVDVTPPELALTDESFGAVWGDVDGDGDLDLYVANLQTPNRLFENQGDGTFLDATFGAAADPGPGVGVAMADVDGDRDLDLYVANLGAANLLLVNTPDGFAGLTPPLLADPGLGTGVAFADGDADGDPDLYVCNLLGSNKLFRNASGNWFDATSTPWGDGGDSRGAAWGDYDGDGDLDCYVGNSDGPNRLIQNRSAPDSSLFAVVVANAPLDTAGNTRGIAWADYDNDGDLDLYVSNGSGSGSTVNKLFENDGVGNFTEVAGTIGGGLDDAGEGRAAAWADIEGDGDLDLFVCNNGGPNRLFRNDLNNGNHWVQVRLEGTASNRDGIGAQVRVVSDSREMVREATAGFGFASQDDVLIEFGTGTDASIESLQVRWPSGVEQIFVDLPADTLLHVRESGFVVDREFPGDDSVQGAAWGDLEPDTDEDLYLSVLSDPNHLLRRSALGVYDDVATSPIDHATVDRCAAWGDYDNDGDQDLYTGRASATNFLFRNDGGGTFTDVTTAVLDDTAEPRALAWVDFDADGDLDLHAINGQVDRLFRNDGGGVFGIVPGSAINNNAQNSAGIWADYDDDGDLDVYVVSASATNRLIQNLGGGVLVDTSAAPVDDAGVGVDADWGDFDNDGDLDLYLVNAGTPNRLFRNEGDGTFVDVTSFPTDDDGSGTAKWVDFDLDGWLDLVLLRGTAEQGRLLRNRGDGTFDFAVQPPFDRFDRAQAQAWADFDLDGDLDAYMAVFGTESVLFRNEIKSGNRWVQFDLRGTVSNAFAIGSRVRIVAGGTQQIREVRAGGRHHAQDSRIVTFGLGGASVVDTAEFRWPSGLERTLVGLAAGERYLILEPNDVVEVPAGPILADLRLERPAPNPMRGETTIRFLLPRRAHVQLLLHDARGRRVARLRDELLDAGVHTTEWGGRSAQGRRLPAGIYWIRLAVEGERRSEKLILLP